MSQELIEQLEKKGVYFTHLVKELVNLLVKSKHPLSIEEALQKLNKNDFFPYKTSLYRQLSRLSALNIIKESIFSDGIKRYCFIYKQPHHYHFFCDKCGAIKEVAINSCKKIEESLSRQIKKQGYKLNDHTMTFNGICSRCIT